MAHTPPIGTPHVPSPSLSLVDTLDDILTVLPDAAIDHLEALIPAASWDPGVTRRIWTEAITREWARVRATTTPR